MQRQRLPERLADLVVAGIGVVTQVRGHRDDEPGRAEPALQAVAVAERGLHRRELVALPQPLHGRDLGAIDLHGEDQARPDRGTVEQHGAGTAHPVLAAEVGAGQAAVAP